LAFIAPVNVSAQAIEASIRKYAGNALSSIELFDVYTGANLGEDVRSLAFRITLRSTERTLSDEEVTKLRVKVIRGVEHDNGVKIRS
jgi:phenylalanyl-tRNA synthetase beta chain